MHAAEPTVIQGPPRAPDSLARLSEAWVRSGLIPPPTDWESERRTIAAVAILGELHDRAGLRSRDHLRQLFHRLTDGEAPLIDALIADAREGTPFCVVTYWEAEDGRSATSVMLKLTRDLDEPILAPTDEWFPMLEGRLPLASLFGKLVDSSVLSFPTQAAR